MIHGVQMDNTVQQKQGNTGWYKAIKTFSVGF